MKSNALAATLIIGATTLLNLSQAQADNKELTKVNIEQSARARMKDANPALTADDEQEIKTVLYHYLDAAFNNDLEDMVDTFAKVDRKRIDEQRSNMVESRVEDNKINSVWKDAYDSDFDDGLEVAAIPVQFGTATGAKGLPRKVQVSLVGRNGEKTETVNLVDEGILKTTWVIDVSDKLSAKELNQSLQQVQLTLGQDVKAESNAKSAYQQFANRMFRAISATN